MPGGGEQVSASLISYLVAHQGSAKYLVAATSSHTTAPIIIQTGKAVVTIGGFSGSDNTPTPAQLEAMVANGELKYVLVSGGGRGRGNTDITTWVTQHGTAVPGMSGLYELSA
jgi:4-amino-4-deoxy-L-arabinose transferase-like glycosyltransferase